MSDVTQPLPPPPDAPTPGEPRTRKVWLWVTVGALMLGAAIAGIVLVSGDEAGLPEHVGDFQRLRNSDTELLESMLGEFQIGDLEIDVATYGRDAKIEVFLNVYRNMPPSDPAMMARGSAAGMVAAGGEADVYAIQVETRDGTTYACFEFSAPLMPGDIRFSDGYSCAWMQGENLAVLLVSTAVDTQSEAVDASAVFAAALGD